MEAHGEGLKELDADSADAGSDMTLLWLVRVGVDGSIIVRSIIELGDSISKGWLI